MDRRGFLKDILTFVVAPIVISSGIARGILMPVKPRILVPGAEGRRCWIHLANGTLFVKYNMNDPWQLAAHRNMPSRIDNETVMDSFRVTTPVRI